eukprot:gb/GECG01002980.1/.p1 GENE.gb/GECG01002980.1/~~gb/GECG01002980.1/.p1  ORF type:complete len:347 (+),score=29.12 gb/GECG01002980.1/:1-1041(+)
MKLATVEKVAHLEPIPDADRLELATVLGWRCIVKKGDFSIGDWCIMVYIDAEVDVNSEPFSFLPTKQANKEGWLRIRTIKLRGVYSQGLVIPTTWLTINCPTTELEESLDLSETLPIRKYQKPEPKPFKGNMGTPVFDSAPFPTHLVSKTDEENAKSNPKTLHEFERLETYITLKLDGSSLTVIHNEGKTLVCSRNLQLLSGRHDMLRYAENQRLEERLTEYRRNVAIQGEFVGPGINKNRLALSEHDWYIFTIKDLDTGRNLGLYEISEICETLGLKLVPLLEKFTFEPEAWTLDYLQEYANQTTYPTSGNVAEGIVIRPTASTYSPTLRKGLSLKIINQQYKDT